MHYHFTTHEAFEAGIKAGRFLEHAHVHKNIYGTSVQAVQDVADSGRCCVLDIDVQGARQVGALRVGVAATPGTPQVLHFADLACRIVPKMVRRPS